MFMMSELWEVLKQHETIFLVRAKIRLKITGSEKTKKTEIEKWDIGKVNKKQVKEEFVKEVTAMYKILK